MKFLILGYFGFDNIGDEAILSVLINEIKRVFDKKVFDIIVFDNAKKIKKRKNIEKVKFVPRYSPLVILQNIIKTDVFVLGGGSLFQDKTSKRSFYYYLIIVLLAIILRKKVCILAQGIGPLRYYINKKLLCYIFHRASLVTVRDPFSLSFFDKFNRKPISNLFLTADLAYLLDKQNHKDSLPNIVWPQNKKRIGLILRESSSVSYTELLDKMKENIHINKDHYILFIPMQPQDKNIYYKLQKDLSLPIVLLEDDLTPGNFLKLLKKLDIVISMRLHGLIFSKIANTKYEAISYDPKIDYFIKDSRTLEQLKNSASENFSLLEKYI